jgi:anti-sigma-K factor RskA
MTSGDDARPGPLGGDAHVDDDTLALLSLGETVASDVSAHVQGCVRCSGRVETLIPVVELARSLQPADLQTMQPPAHVWEAIAADIEMVTTQPETASTARSAPTDPTPPARVAATAATTRPVAWLLAAAAVGVLVGASAVVGWRAVHDDHSDSPAASVVESTRLQPLPAERGSGTAEIHQVSNGRELSVQVHGAAPHHAYLEVWLMSDPQHLVSLGVLDGGAGSFAVPPGINLNSYKIVDVSVEPYDGNPAHSTDSLVRGTLAPS